MKRLLLLPMLLGSVVVVGSTSPPAYAKGATDVVVSGPGIPEVSLSYTQRTDDVDVSSLAEASGIYLIYGAGIAEDDPGLTRAELGPRYRLTWYVAGTVMADSDVYPFARSGAWTHIPADDDWIRGGPGLERAMVELGAAYPEPDAEPQVLASTAAVGSASPTEVEPVAASTSTVSFAGQAAWPGLAALVALVAGAAWYRRHRRATTG